MNRAARLHELAMEIVARRRARLQRLGARHERRAHLARMKGQNLLPQPAAWARGDLDPDDRRRLRNQLKALRKRIRNMGGQA